MVFPGFVRSGLPRGYEKERNTLHDASSHPCPDSESVWNVFIDVVPYRVLFSGIKKQPYRILTIWRTALLDWGNQRTKRSQKNETGEI
jgi:hypothetical protein